MSLSPWALLPTWLLTPGIAPTADILYSIKNVQVIVFVHVLQNLQAYCVKTVQENWYLCFEYPG